MSQVHSVHDATGVVAKNDNGEYLIVATTTVPSDGSSGYSPGCILIHTDGGAGTALYVNEGTSSSSNFDAVAGFDAQSALTTELTDLSGPGATPGTPDYAIQAITNSTPYGFVTADEAETVISVVQNNKTRIAEIETALQTLGLLS